MNLSVSKEITVIVLPFLHLYKKDPFNLAVAPLRVPSVSLRPSHPQIQGQYISHPSLIIKMRNPDETRGARLTTAS